MLQLCEGVSVLIAFILLYGNQDAYNTNTYVLWLEETLHSSDFLTLVMDQKEVYGKYKTFIWNLDGKCNV